MSEMIERMAFVTCHDIAERGVCTCDKGAKMRQDCRERARAAITAMASPTSGMIDLSRKRIAA